MVPLLYKTDSNGVASPAYPHSDYVYALNMVAATAQTVTVPPLATIAMFACTQDFYFNPVGTAVVPAANIIDGTAPMLNPVLRSGLVPGSTFSVITKANANLTISWYK